MQAYSLQNLATIGSFSTAGKATFAAGANTNIGRLVLNKGAQLTTNGATIIGDAAESPVAKVPAVLTA